MTTGIALHIGLNFVNPIHYSGWDGKLAAAVKIMNLLPPEQTPNYYNIGQPNPAFDDQKPFTI